MSRTAPTTRSRTTIRIGFLLVLIIAAGLRLWRIDSIPPGFHFDESFEGLEAWRILTVSSYRPIFLTGNFGVPPLNAYANAITFGIFGALGGEAGPTATRTTAAFFGILGVVAVYLLATELRRLDSWPESSLSLAFPLLAAAMLAVMRWHIHFSRMGIEPIIVPLIWTASTWLLLRGWRTGSKLAFIACGVVLAAGMYTYQAAWFVPLIMLPVAGILIFDRRSKNKDRGASSSVNAATPDLGSSLFDLLLAAGTATLLILPLLWFFMQNPDLLLLRPTQLVIVGETGSPADNSIGQSIWATAKMFGPLGSPGDMDPRRNLPGAPALNLWLAIPFYLGLGLAFWRIRRPAYAITLIGLIGMLLPGIFSEYAPHFHRVLGASAPVALLGGFGLDWIWSWSRLRRWRLQWIAVLLLVIGGFTSAQTYFTRWSTLPDLHYAFDAGFWEMSQWIAQQPDDEPLYITPRGDEHPTLAFAWREPGDVAPHSFDGRHIFPLTQAAAERDEHYLVVEHEDFRTRLLLPEVFPDAVVTREFVDREDNVYARVYTRPALSAAQRPPQVAVDQPVGDGIRLAGYDLLPAAPRPGEMLYLQLHWLTDGAPSEDWTVFTHVIDPADGSVVAGRDSQPGNGSLPTDHWQSGWRLLDEYQIQLPADLPSGEYGLRVGLYRNNGSTLPDDGLGIDLGTFVVGQE